jgi:two-component system cell cycle sensor histidine kinase/response regulator CckA
LLGEKVEIIISKKTEYSTILADKNQIEQIIMNLALNAKDAMREGGKLNISISKRSLDLNAKDSLNTLYKPAGSGEIELGNYIELKIKDTGTGIKQDILHRVFEPFFTTKGNLKGTGLGLSTVYEIIKQTGGYLYVHSDKTGTTFYILFKEYQEAASSSRNARVINEISNAEDEQKMAVLVVEDEEPVRVFSAHALRNKGYFVFEAENGEQALEIFKKNRELISTVVTDVIMPGINGPELAAKILEIKKQTNIILMSGYTEEEIAPLSNEKFHFLSKPFSLDKLVETVNSAALAKEEA